MPGLERRPLLTLSQGQHPPVDESLVKMVFGKLRRVKPGKKKLRRTGWKRVPIYRREDREDAAPLLERERKLTKKQIAAGKPPAGWTWKQYMKAGGTFGGKKSSSKKKKSYSRPPRPKKKKKQSKLPFMNPNYKKKRNRTKSGKKLAPFPTSFLDLDDSDWGDEPEEMGSWALKKKSRPPKPKLSPEQEKLKKMVRAVRGPIRRQAAGGLVFKSFKGDSPNELLVLCAKVHPKYGGGWVFPKGGLDPGESLHQGGVREVLEETGVKARVLINKAFVTKSTFGGTVRYDWELVRGILKKKFPKDKAFIDAHEKEIRLERVTFQNSSHYYVMQHVGGKPITSPDPHEEMSMAEYVPLHVAYGRGHRMGKAIDALWPVIHKLWRGVNPDAPRATKLRKAKPKTIKPSKPHTSTKGGGSSKQKAFSFLSLF